jgi:hypothetical protein
MKNSFMFWARGRPRRAVVTVRPSENRGGRIEISGVQDSWEGIMAIYQATEKKLARMGVKARWFQYHPTQRKIMVRI